MPQVEQPPEPSLPSNPPLPLPQFPVLHMLPQFPDLQPPRVLWCKHPVVLASKNAADAINIRRFIVNSLCDIRARIGLRTTNRAMLLGRSWSVRHVPTQRVSFTVSTHSSPTMQRIGKTDGTILTTDRYRLRSSPSLRMAQFVDRLGRHFPNWFRLQFFRWLAALVFAATAFEAAD